MIFDGTTVSALIDPESPVPFFPIMQIRVNDKPDDKKNYETNAKVKFRLAWALDDVISNGQVFQKFPFKSIKLPNQRSEEEPTITITMSNVGLSLEQEFLESAGTDEEFTVDLFVVRGNDPDIIVAKFEKYYIHTALEFTNTEASITLAPKSFFRRSLGVLYYRPNTTKAVFS